MADYYRGSIEIGGSISESDLPEFIKVIGASDIEDFSPVEDGSLEGDEFIEEVLRQCHKDGQAVEMSSCEARYGRFPDLEDFCKRHNLVFKAFSDQYCEYTPEAIYFNGVTEKIVPTSDDQDTIINRGSLVAYMVTIRNMCKDLSKLPLFINSENFFEKAVSKIMLKDNITDPIEVLSKILDDRYPDISGVIIPPLRIVP